MEDRRRHRSCILRPGSRAAPAPTCWTRTFPNMDPTGLAAAGLVLLLLYLTARFLWRYNKNAAQAQQAAAAAAASSSSASRQQPVAAAGAAPSLPAASPLPSCTVPLSSSPSSSSMLPVFFVLHVAVPPGPGTETAECAVCLAEFGEREAGRLLPRCGHAFHEQCIATWLRLSTTCPLCRTPVAAK